MKDFRTYFLAVIPLILSIITSLLNIAFVILAIYVLDRRKVGRRLAKFENFCCCGALDIRDRAQ